MVRLNAQLINMSAQKHNPVRDWELDLRGYRIPVIENLGATLDQFDTIDFTDNDIRKLDQFPLLKRLKHILLSNNRIVRIAEDLQENLPNLETLVLTNNSIKELSDVDPLSSVKTLQYLSFLGNPVVTKRNYRLYVIHKIPSLRVLDFRKIKLRERETAAKLFKKKKAPQPKQTPVTANGTAAVKAKTFTPGDKLTPSKPAPAGPSKADVAAIRKAIANAKTLEEIERLNQMLKTGQIPGQNLAPGSASQRKGAEKVAEVEEEEEEEDEEQEMQPSESGMQEEADMEEGDNQATGGAKQNNDEEEEEDDDDETEEEEDMDDN